VWDFALLCVCAEEGALHHLFFPRNLPQKFKASTIRAELECCITFVVVIFSAGPDHRLSVHDQ